MIEFYLIGVVISFIFLTLYMGWLIANDAMPKDSGILSGLFIVVITSLFSWSFVLVVASAVVFESMYKDKQ